MKPTRSTIRGDRVPAPADLKPVLARHFVLPGHEIAASRVQRRETIAKFLERADWQFRLPTICVINGEPVLRKQWRRRRIKVSDDVCFISKPWGKSSGSGKQILGLVALIALSAFAPGIGTAIGGALGLPATIFGVATGTLIGAGITLGGALLINALTAPKPGGQNDVAFPNVDPIYSVSATGNTGKPLQPLPVWYGKLKRFPDFAATPWSEFVGNDQYLNVLLALGCGKYAVHELSIDDTAFWDSVDGYDPEFPDITVALYDPGEDVDLFPINITQSVEVSGQELPDPALPPTPGWVGGFIANASGTSAQSLAVDLIFPGGCYTVSGSGGIAGATVQIIVEARQVDGAGAPLTSYAQIIDKTVTLATRNPQRLSEKVDVTPGRYEVRVRRTSAPLSGTAGSDGVVWAGLRAFLAGPSSFAGVSTVALRIKANAQLNANSAKKFGVLATRILSVWNGSIFVEAETQNPYWALYDAATNTDYGARRPVSKIDFQNIVDGAAAATARGDTFNYCFTQVSAIPQAFDTILKSTRARHRWSGDVLTTVRDEWRAVPEILLTDREIIRGSLSVDWLLNTDDSADAVILEYLDGVTWRPAEVQYPPDSEVFTATNPARARIDGVTDRAHAYREAAFIYLQSQKRRTNVTLDTEHDGRRLAFGSAVRVQSELPQAWGATGVVVSRDDNELTLDPAPVWAATGQHYIGIRDKRGRLFGPVKCSVGAAAAIAVLDPTDLTAVETGGQSLADTLARADGADDPSFAFGVGSSWSRPCVVVSGRPNKDKVTVALFVDDIDVHATELGGTPVAPPAPDLVDAKAPQIAGLSAAIRQGIAEPMLYASWWPAPGAFYYLAQISYDAGNSWAPFYEGTDNSFSRPVDLAGIRLRVAAVGTRHGAWVFVDLDPPVISIAEAHLSGSVQATLDAVPIAFANALAALRAVVDPTRESIFEKSVGDAAIRALLAGHENKSQFQNNLIQTRQDLTVLLDTETAARVSAVTAILAQINDPSTGLSSRASASSVLAIQTFLNDPTYGTFATASAISTLNASVSSNAAAIVSEATTRANADTALAGTITTLTSTVNSNTSAISSEATTRANADTALSGTIATLTSTVGSNTAAISSEAATRASADTALAGSISTLSSTVGGNTASISTINTSVNGVLVQFGVIGTINGVSGGFIMSGIKKLDGSVTYAVEIDGSLVVTGSITASHLAISTLDAITANVGRLTAGKLADAASDAASHMVIDLAAGTITGYA